MAQDPLAPQVGIGTEVRAYLPVGVRQEDRGMHPNSVGSLRPRLGAQGDIAGDESFSLLLISLQQTLLGPLQHEAQTMQAVGDVPIAGNCCGTVAGRSAAR